MKDLKIFTNNIEQNALDQVNLLLEQEPFKDCKVRIMPDVHAGSGCVIGFTGDLGDKVIPNIVGVDIGCGMYTVNLGKQDIDFEKLDKIIHQYIPFGRDVHLNPVAKLETINNLKCFRELKDTKRFKHSIGTLGGGNHFIEIDKDDEDNFFLVIHTGSRNLGKQVADYYQELAFEIAKGKNIFMDLQEKLIKEYKEQGRKNEIQNALIKLKKEFVEKQPNIPKELCYLEGKYREMYLHDMKICQEFAKLNRETIAKIICDKMNWIICDEFETIHNYISFEDNIVRKGAISSKKGERLLIPINMKDGCILGFGKGNADWNYSAPHGAGRIMSRTEAKEKLNVEDFKDTMNGIYTTTANEKTLDEAPMAYKPMQEIIDNIKDTVEIIKIIKPIYNFKASE